MFDFAWSVYSHDPLVKKFNFTVIKCAVASVDWLHKGDCGTHEQREEWHTEEFKHHAKHHLIFCFASNISVTDRSEHLEHPIVAENIELPCFKAWKPVVWVVIPRFPFFKWFELVFLAKVHPDASAKVRQEQHTGINNDVTNNLLDYVRTLAWHHFLEKDVDGLKESSEVPHS